MLHTNVQRFDGYNEYLAYITSPTDMERNTRASLDGGKHFTETASMDEALELARGGWDEGTKMIEEMSLALTDQIIKTVDVPEIRFDVTGDELDIGRFVEGEPEDFMTLVPVEIDQEPKILHITAYIGASGGTSKETMIRRGAAVVALIDALEKFGKRCEVDLCGVAEEFSRGGNNHLDTIVRVKEAHEAVNLATLAFALAHPSSYRRLMFSAWEHLDAHDRNALGIKNGSGYGMPTETSLEHRGDIHVGKTMHMQSPEDAKEFVLDQLEKQGVKVTRADVAPAPRKRHNSLRYT